MPEAEDVLIEAAEHATAFVRGLWAADDQADARPDRLAGRRRVLSHWLVACFGHDWPIVATDPAPPPGWLERRLSDPAPWRTPARAPLTSDGRSLYVPRNGLHDELLLVAVLGLGSRLERDALRWRPETAAARDLFWAAEGAVADARLARELPGLSQALHDARERARAQRPARDALHPAERLVESQVQRLLEAPLAEPSRNLGADLSPSALAGWARAHAPVASERYRGAARVLHWGCDWGAAKLPAPAPAGAPRGEPAPAGRSRSLPRWVRPRAAEEDEADARSGAFVLPFADPQGAVQDARGLRRPEDRGDDLDLDVLSEELAAQSELLRVRSDRPAHEVLAAEEGAPPPGPAEAGLEVAAEREEQSPGVAYPEWDCRTSRYRAAWCVVRERPASAGDGDFGERVRHERRALLRRIRRELEPLRPRRVRRPRQRDGDDVDTEAWVDAFAARAAGRTPDDRLYRADRPIRRDVALTLLVDASASTDATVTGTRRVIDVEKEATLCFADALDGLGDRFSVQAFSSRGPRDVRVQTMKAFASPWDAASVRRLAGLAPDAFTRLGGALRHATADLARQSARQRLLLLLSDGRPDDEDEYEGRYGLEDVRQAVAEARLQRVRVFCLNVDRRGTEWLPHLFGPGGFSVLPRVEQLPERLPEIYRALTS